MVRRWMILVAAAMGMYVVSGMEEVKAEKFVWWFIVTT